MARHDPTELAKAAYAAYGGATGGKNYRGEPMPAWDDLGTQIQTAWEVAAEATARMVLGLTRRADGQSERKGAAR
ncbi:hypothetical protein [Streptomyces cylindrosporus]|uniref:Uncharacterized protein n=1 Tax=Streptomyces cylindrosporus TaxID=2927583 RepID=A0ABS9YLW7_9ACTN|nr:hypothetical protein [Streptomyces cylindrosporus]MCI3277541.1 hypothetical protein [Streptomyces cylindrosporus]